jgi:hypothetical protein
VLSSLLLFVLIFVGIGVVLFAGTLLLQGAIYSEPVTGLLWRAPVAAAIVTLFLAGWCTLAGRSPGNYNTIFDFTAGEEEHFKQFWSVKRGRESLYISKPNSRNRMEPREKETNKIWSRSDSDGVVEAIIVEDKDGEKIRLEAELTPDGKFKAAQGEPVRYVEVGGKHRVMTDSDIGNISVVRWGRIYANIFLNLLHFIVWFAALWLILRFQWGHAFGLALALWLVVTFAIMPMLFKRAEDAARDVNRSVAAVVRPEAAFALVEAHRPASSASAVL